MTVLITGNLNGQQVNSATLLLLLILPRCFLTAHVFCISRIIPSHYYATNFPLFFFVLIVMKMRHT